MGPWFQAAFSAGADPSGRLASYGRDAGLSLWEAASQTPSTIRLQSISRQSAQAGKKSRDDAVFHNLEVSGAAQRKEDCFAKTKNYCGLDGITTVGICICIPQPTRADPRFPSVEGAMV